MYTSMIELPDELHQRISTAAEQAGVTTHDLILQALEDMLDRHDAEVQEDDRREEELMRTGLSIAHADVVDYFERRARGEEVAKPPPRKFRP